MARYQINHYVDLPFGQLHIFTNPAETAKAERLIKDTPKIFLSAASFQASHNILGVSLKLKDLLKILLRYYGMLGRMLLKDMVRI